MGDQIVFGFWFLRINEMRRVLELRSVKVIIPFFLDLKFQIEEQIEKVVMGFGKSLITFTSGSNSIKTSSSRNRLRR
jgi:hypothetical protein